MTERFFTDPDGATLRVMDYHGYPAQPFAEVGERFDLLHELPIRDDDVLLAGYPKSGNHWTIETINRILLNNTSETYWDDIAKYSFEYKSRKELDALASPRVFLTHAPHFIAAKAAKLFDGRHKIVYVVRNPKDVAVSYYTQTYKFRAWYGYDGKWSGYFKLFVDGQVDSGSWFDHVQGWEKYKDEHPEIPIHFVFYEDLKQDLIGEIRKLSEFLERPKPESFYEKLRDISVFSLMKKRHDANATDELKNLYRDGNNIMFRKGIIGDWKQFFTVAQSEYFDTVYAEKMKSSSLKFRFSDTNRV